MAIITMTAPVIQDERDHINKNRLVPKMTKSPPPEPVEYEDDPYDPVVRRKTQKDNQNW